MIAPHAYGDGLGGLLQLDLDEGMLALIGIDDVVLHALLALRDTWDGPPPRILISDSLYLAGAMLAENGTPPT